MGVLLGMRTTLKKVDSVSEWTGRIVCWLCVGLLAVSIYEVSMRYVFNAPTSWAYETLTMLGGTIYVVAWCYVHRYGRHVRVDIFYRLLSQRAKAVIDVTCALLFFFPLLAALTYTSARWMWRAWSINEVMCESYWYPPAGPFRTIVFLGLCLFALQGIVQFIRDLHLLIAGKPYE